MVVKFPWCRALVAALFALVAHAAGAQTVIEQAAEHRFQIDFRVNDAALFEGTEKVVSWDSFPWYIRTVSAP